MPLPHQRQRAGAYTQPPRLLASGLHAGFAKRPGKASRENVAVSRLAIVRAPGPRLADCELTHQSRRPIDAELARSQHDGYCEALRSLGCAVMYAPELPEHPDAAFVEDLAVVVDEVALVTRPGAVSRQGEAASLLPPLRRWRAVEALFAADEDGTLDGGDVLRVGRRIWVGRSTRTGAEGLAALGRRLAPLGYDVAGVGVAGCLHLKSAVTALDEETLVFQPGWIDPAPFKGLRLVEAHPDEPGAASVLAVGGRVVMAAEHPLTRARIESAGFAPLALPLSEILAAEAGPTCCSLLLRDTSTP